MAHERYPEARFYDLLDTTLTAALSVRPSLLREEVLAQGPETVVVNEVRAWIEYEQLELPLAFWRTSSGFEVDLIVGQLELALECKSTREVRTADLKGLRALKDEHVVRRSVVVSRERERRRTDDGIEILPWQELCRELWEGTLLSGECPT